MKTNSELKSYLSYTQILRSKYFFFRLEGFPSITSLQFDGALQLGVGTATGQVLCYDIRASRPSIIKDHLYGLPIKDVDFHPDGYVYSMDSSILKIWERNTVSLFMFHKYKMNKCNFNHLC